MSPFQGQKEGEGTPVQERRRCEHRNDRVLPTPPPLHTKVDTLTVLLIDASDLTARTRRRLSCWRRCRGALGGSKISIRAAATRRAAAASSPSLLHPPLPTLTDLRRFQGTYSRCLNRIARKREGRKREGVGRTGESAGERPVARWKGHLLPLPLRPVPCEFQERLTSSEPIRLTAPRNVTSEKGEEGGKGLTRSV